MTPGKSPMPKRLRHRILIVDDEPMMLRVAHSILKGEPYEVLFSATADDAIHLLAEGDITLLICDLIMPKIDGNAVLAAARRYNPAIISILTTGFPDADSVIKAINEGGIWKVMRKPWHAESFLAMVREGIERAEMLAAQVGNFKDLAKRISVSVTRHPLEAEMEGGRDYEKPAAHVREGGRHRIVVVKKEHHAKHPDLFDDRYRILELIGQGGIGVVYKAEDTLLNIPVAIKVLSTEFTRHQSKVELLKGEARIAMQLSHKHIVKLFNLQVTDQRYYLVMEYVPGCNFRNVLEVDGKLPLSTVLQVLVCSADALDHAHRHGVLHRDLKPENIMLTHDGILKIIDFGIAAIRGNTTDSFAGTPVYMSPEALQNKPVDQTSDVYAMGVVTHELLTGQLPFPGDELEPDDILKLQPVFADEIPERARGVLARAMAPEPTERWLSMGTYAHALHEACGIAYPI